MNHFLHCSFVHDRQEQKVPVTPSILGKGDVKLYRHAFSPQNVHFSHSFFFSWMCECSLIPKKKTSHISTVFWKNTTHQNKSVTITIHPPTLNIRSLPCPFSNLSFPCNYMHAACWCPAGRTLPLAYETKLLCDPLLRLIQKLISTRQAACFLPAYRWSLETFLVG